MEVRVKKTENKVKTFIKNHKAEISAVVGGATISIATFVYIFNKKWNKIVDSKILVGENNGNLAFRIDNYNRYGEYVNHYILTAKDKELAIRFLEVIKEKCNELYG